MIVGYACVNTSLDGVTTNRTCRKKTFTEKGLSYVSELAVLNARDLKTILEWNVENSISFFRVSCIFPWATEYKIRDLPDFKQIRSILGECGAYAEKHNIRLTSHPDHFVKMGSPNEELVLQSMHTLEAHSTMFDLMGLTKTPWNKINIHIGGTYGNKIDTIDRFGKNIQRLSDNCLSRLTVENDDSKNGYHIVELFAYLYNKAYPVPLVFDYHHHLVSGAMLSVEDAVRFAKITWPRNIPPVVHYSESRKDAKSPKAHSDYVTNIPKTDAHIMLEAKAKEKAILKLRKENKL